MKKSKLERNIVIFLFFTVLVAFSFAQRDSKKLEQLYTHIVKAGKEMLATVSN